MIPTVTALALLCAAPAPVAELPTAFWQVAPDAGGKLWAPPAAPGTQKRAVVLIPGLSLHPLRPARAMVADRRPWQEPNSELVKALAPDADVFAFGYAQTVRVEDVAAAPGLRDAVARLRKGGYTEIVLIGHSAGGVIARLFAESNPDAGTTKVIAVAAPFAGAEAAALRIGYPKVQAAFVRSLAPDARTAPTANKPLGKDVGFACVVCKLKRVESDGVVTAKSQWPDDLQRAGVPAVLAPVSHFDVMLDAPTSKAIAGLVREQVARWEQPEVDRARKVLFGK